MLGRVEVFRGVFVARGIAATNMSAMEAEPKMDPGIAALKALLATAGMRLDVVNLIQMRALRRSHVYNNTDCLS